MNRETENEEGKDEEKYEWTFAIVRNSIFECIAIENCVQTQASGSGELFCLNNVNYSVDCLFALLEVKMLLAVSGFL